MRPTKSFEKLLTDPKVDSQTLTYSQEGECEICGIEPLEAGVTFICSVAHLGHEGWGEYWQNRYDVCLDCVEAGVASFPDRLRKHAQELEAKARELRKLADAKWSASGPDDPEDCRADNDPS